MKALGNFARNFLHYLLFTARLLSVILLMLLFLASCDQSGNQAKVVVEDSTKTVQADTTPVLQDVAAESKPIETTIEKTAPVHSTEKPATEKSKTFQVSLPKDPVVKENPAQVIVEKKQEPVEIVTHPVKTEVIAKVPEKVISEPSVNPEANWPVPAKYSAMKNPSPGNKGSIALGKEIFSKHCKSCHGSSGKGDGTKAASLNTQIRSFQSSAVKSQKAGDIYYKSFVGRNEMPNFEKKILDEEDRWGVVNYILSL